MIKILFIGDIVAKPGRRTIAHVLPGLRTQHDIDVVIANGENLSHGRGIELTHYDAMREAGIDWFTTGNHVWARQGIWPFLNDPAIHILRPANYPAKTPGRGLASFEIQGIPFHLINLQGRVFMPEATNNPFTAFDQLTERLDGLILVDFHAEATSEKWAFGHYVTDRATVVVGTHTHVPTADERILGTGTAFISDLGMTGTLDSVIGVEKQQILDHFISGLPWRYEVAESGPTWFNAALVTVDPTTRHAVSITRIQQLID